MFPIFFGQCLFLLKASNAIPKRFGIEYKNLCFVRSMNLLIMKCNVISAESRKHFLACYNVPECMAYSRCLVIKWNIMIASMSARLRDWERERDWCVNIFRSKNFRWKCGSSTILMDFRIVIDIFSILLLYALFNFIPPKSYSRGLITCMLIPLRMLWQRGSISIEKACWWIHSQPHPSPRYTS